MKFKLKTPLYMILTLIGIAVAYPLQGLSNTSNLDWIAHWSYQQISTETEGNHAFTSLISKGNKAPAFLEKQIEAPLSLKGKHIKLWLRIKNLSALSGIELRLFSGSGFDNYAIIPITLYSDPEFNLLKENTWFKHSFAFSQMQSFGQFNINNVTRVGFYIGDNGSRSVRVDLSSFSVIDNWKNGIVSFTFDDGYAEHHEAARIMARYGLRGTAYIMPNSVGKSAQFVNLGQLFEMRDKFLWGISSHHEIPLTAMGPWQLETEIQQTLSFFAQNGFLDAHKHFAFPLGKHEFNYVMPLSREYFVTSRVAGGGVETLPPADWHRLRVVNVTPQLSPNDILKLVRSAKQNKEWVILMFHYLNHSPQNDLSYSWSDFRTVVQSIAQEDIAVMPVHEVWEQLN